MSQDEQDYGDLIRTHGLYRLSLGQPHQADHIALRNGTFDDEELAELVGAVADRSVTQLSDEVDRCGSLCHVDSGNALPSSTTPSRPFPGIAEPWQTEGHTPLEREATCDDPPRPTSSARPS